MNKPKHCYDKYFIRFGEIPLDEQSTEFIGSGDGKMPNKKLDGVSVYECILDERNQPRLVLPRITSSTMNSLHGLLEYSNRNIYLVYGNVVGIGSDGEPLLRNVEIIKKLKPNVLKYETYRI